jgi:hypothetical protein
MMEVDQGITKIAYYSLNHNYPANLLNEPLPAALNTGKAFFSNRIILGFEEFGKFHM